VGIAQGGYALAPAFFGAIREYGPAFFGAIREYAPAFFGLIREYTPAADGAAPAVFACAALLHVLAMGAFLAGRR
jgi:hypothetical protein